MADDFDLADPRNRAAVEKVLADLGEYMDEMDAREQHVVLITDPQTGTRHVVGGPWPNRLHAKIAIALIKASNDRVDPDLADLVYEPLVFVDRGLPRLLDEAARLVQEAGDGE